MKVTPLEDLPRREQVRFLLEFAVPKLRSLYLNDANVLDINLGAKRRGGEHLGRGLCVKVYVRRKRKRPKSMIPPRLVVRVPGGRAIEVPTDVDQVGALTLEGNVRPGVPIAGRDTGTAGFLIRDDSTWLVTAAHVLHEHSAPPPDRATWGGGGHGSFVPKSTWRTEFLGGDGLVDAGLVKVDSEGHLGSAAGHPWGSRLVAYDESPQHFSVRVCGKNGVVSCTFNGLFSSGNGKRWFRRSIRGITYLQPRELETGRGDSGAPILAGEEGGVLVGMHLGGTIDDQGRKLGVALCASDLIQIFRDSGLLGRA